jgi:hypothetical protein
MSENSAHTTVLRLKMLDYVKPYRLPNRVEIVKQVRATFPEDPALSVLESYVNREVVYTIVLTNPVPKEGNLIRLKVRGAEKAFPLVHDGDELVPKSRNFENTILLTFKNPGLEWSKGVPNKDIDSLIQNDLGLELEKPTQHQTYKGTDVYNGNRCCVIQKPDNLQKIPREIPIINPITNETLIAKVTYNGQEYHCRRCSEFHAGQCPELAEFYKAKEMKEEMRKKNQILTKVVADSTLRNVDPLGLKADVMCVPGAALGQVAQTLHDDPDCEEARNIVMAAGSNDMFNDKIDNDLFAYGVDKGIEKVKELAKNYPDKSIQLVTPMMDGDTLTTNQRIRCDYIYKKVSTVAFELENVEHLDRAKLQDLSADDEPNSGIEMEDMRHPSPDGTKKLVMMMKDYNGDSLVWNDKYIINDQRYRRIQTIPRYGCKGCPVFKERPISDESGLCTECQDNYVKGRGNPLLAEISKSIYDEAKKRKRSGDQSDGDYAKKPFGADPSKTPDNRLYAEMVCK